MDNLVWYDPNDLQEVKKALAHMNERLADAIKDRDLYKNLMQDQARADERYLFQHCVTAMLMNPTVQVLQLDSESVQHICALAQVIIERRRKTREE